MAQIFECVPNISEGRRKAVVDAVGAAAVAGDDVVLVDTQSDASHNRSVYTLVGTGEGVLNAAIRLTGAAIEQIDLRTHRGEHPRMGAVDVIPFVPIGATTMDDAVQLARHCAAEIWNRYRVPSYFYEAAAARPDRRDLANVRKGGFEALLEATKDPQRQPDVGGPALHPTAGAIAVGARDFLIAYNVNLATADVKVAARIAHAVRQRSGGFLGIKALGFEAGAGVVQVSMNVVNYRACPLYRVTELIRREAGAAGVSICGCELVGLSPLAAIADSAAYYLHLDAIDTAHVTW